MESDILKSLTLLDKDYSRALVLAIFPSIIAHAILSIVPSIYSFESNKLYF